MTVAPDAEIHALLAARPDQAGWQRLCALLELLPAERLAGLTPEVLRWPAAQRPMPDHWWAQWATGDVRPHHALAGTRRLGRLDSVETGTVPSPVADDWADDWADELPEGAGEDGAEGTDDWPDDPADDQALPLDGGAYFYNGVTAVGAPPGLRWIALAAAAEWHHDGGDIVRWDTTRDAPLVRYLDGGDYHDEAYDLQVSPDGETVVTAVEGGWRAWSARTGEPLWRIVPRTATTATANDRADDDGCPIDDGCLSMDDLVRFAFSADSRRLAVGTGSSDVVAVVETGTGRVLLRVPEGEDAFGPVALDATGRLLLHAGPAGRVVLRTVDDGTVLATADTGLTTVAALAFAPDAAGAIAVGGVVGGAPESAGLATAAHPAARLLTLRDATLTPGRLLRPTGFTEGLDADSPTAAITARAIWTAAGPHAFVGADFGSLLFDGEGRTLWADPASAMAAFTADGAALVVVQEEIDAWFLAGCAPPADAAPPLRDPGPGQVLLAGLPGELPCSYQPVRDAAVADGARALVFSAALDRHAASRPLLLCRLPADGGPPDVRQLPPVPGAGHLAGLAIGPRGDVVARGLLGDEPCLVLDEVMGGERCWRHELTPAAPHGEERLRLAFSADGSRLVLASHAAARVLVLDAETGGRVFMLTERGGLVDQVALDASGERVACGLRAGATRVVVRDVTTGKTLLRAEPEQLRWITGLAFAPDGSALAVAGSTLRGHAALWLLPLTAESTARRRAAPRIAVRDLPMHDHPDGALVWTAAGPRAYFPGSHGRSALWDAATDTVLAELPFAATEAGVALSPDGETLVTVTQFGARRWPLGPGREHADGR
ncbi:WD40 repeat domain-containing protein [Streptomyces mayteni]